MTEDGKKITGLVDSDQTLRIPHMIYMRYIHMGRYYTGGRIHTSTDDDADACIEVRDV